MKTSTPTEDDLHAYIDGQLDAAQRQWVEEYLQQNPEWAQRVAGWQRDNQHLRVAIANYLPPPVQRPVEPQTLRRALLIQRQRRLAIAATVLITLGVGGFGGWQLRGRVLQSQHPPMEDAVQAYKLFVDDRQTAFDLVASDNNAVDNWVSRYFINSSRPPNLENYGFKIQGARLMATEQGLSGLILYKNPQGVQVTYYIRPAVTTRLSPGQRQTENLVAQYWSDSKYNYALVSPAANSQADPVQKAIADYNRL